MLSVGAGLTEKDWVAKKISWETKGFWHLWSDDCLSALLYKWEDGAYDTGFEHCLVDYEHVPARFEECERVRDGVIFRCEADLSLVSWYHCVGTHPQRPSLPIGMANSSSTSWDPLEGKTSTFDQPRPTLSCVCGHSRLDSLDY
jgi:hypothetical protein